MSLSNAELIDALSAKPIMEIVELVKALEEKWGVSAAAPVVAAALLSRVMLCGCIEWRFDLPRQNYWLLPLQDVIAFGIFVTSFFGATVHWRGADFRVSADGTLLEGPDLRGSS